MVFHPAAVDLQQVRMPLGRFWRSIYWREANEDHSAALPSSGWADILGPPHIRDILSGPPLGSRSRSSPRRVLGCLPR